MDHKERMKLARRSLNGLSVGDAFGERFFNNLDKARDRQLPEAPWGWTDDTAMAISIVEALEEKQKIDPDDLAHRFADRYQADPQRGYGAGAHRILQAIGQGTPWSTAAGGAFEGQGSMGNGSAMRVAPVGAYFGDDINKAIHHARQSAVVTHAHPEGAAGAVAVAVAGVLAVEGNLDKALELLPNHVPKGEVRDGIVRAGYLGADVDVAHAADNLGNGAEITCPETVPFCIWAAARYAGKFEDAMWDVAAVGGDIDTNCAIVGGLLSLTAEVPVDWENAREPLP